MKASCRTLRAKPRLAVSNNAPTAVKSERIGIAGGTLNGVPGDHGHRRTKRGHLRQRKIGKHHVPPQHLEAKPGVNTGEDDGGRERQRCKCENILQHAIAQFDAADSARASAPTL